MLPQDIEREIYKTFYALHPDSDARSNGLWKAVLDARKDSDENALLIVLEEVKEGIYE